MLHQRNHQSEEQIVAPRAVGFPGAKRTQRLTPSRRGDQHVPRTRAAHHSHCSMRTVPANAATLLDPWTPKNKPERGEAAWTTLWLNLGRGADHVHGRQDQAGDRSSASRDDVRDVQVEGRQIVALDGADAGFRCTPPSQDSSRSWTPGAEEWEEQSNAVGELNRHSSAPCLIQCRRG